MVVEYDFGLHSDDLKESWNGRPGFRSESIEVNGVHAVLVEARADDVGDGRSSSQFLTGASFPIEETKSRALTIVVQHRTADERSLALEIIRSVKFAPR